jgi:hypothetical protein
MKCFHERKILYQVWKVRYIFAAIVIIFLASPSKADEFALDWEHVTHGGGKDVERAVYDTALDANYVYAVGYNYQAYGGSVDGYNEESWRVQKLNRITGQPDPSFNFNQQIMGIAQAVAVDSSGIYVGGNNLSRGMINFNGDTWLIKKLDFSGNEIWSVTGLANTFNYLTRSDTNGVPSGPHSMAIDATGIYLAGHLFLGDSFNAYSQWIVEKRSLGDGSVIWRQIVNPPATTNKFMTAMDIAVNGSDLYVGGYYYIQFWPGPKTDSYLEKRTASAPGTLQFPAKQSDSPTPADSLISSLNISNGSLYVGANKDRGLGSPREWIVQKRDLNTLAVTKQIDENYASTNEKIYDISAGTKGLYLSGYTYDTSNMWHLERRNPVDLSLDSFIDLDLSIGDEKSRSLDVAGDEIYAGGQQYTEDRVEKRRDVKTCKLEFYPTAPVNMQENTVNTSYSVRLTADSDPAFCTAKKVSISQTSGSAGVVNISLVNPLNLPQSLSIQAGAISALSESFGFRVICDPTDPDCTAVTYTPADLTINVLKTCTISCSPLEQKVFAGGTAHVTGATNDLSSPIIWSIPSGSEYVQSSGPSGSNQYDLKIKPDAVYKNITVQVQNYCGVSSCTISTKQAGWVEATP